MDEGKVYDILRRLYEQNVKPHMVYLVLKHHEDGELHRGIELVKRGYDVTEVYDAIELLVAKGHLTRFGKQTKITENGQRILEFIERIISIAEKMVL
jgi:predicted transcriptional regulator